MTDTPKAKSHDKPGKGQAPATAASARKGRDAAPPTASMNADAESGGATIAAATPGRAPEDPAKPYLEKDAQAEAHHEVRAGPGDAGQQAAPDPLPKTPRTAKASWARIALWFAVPIAVLLAIYWAVNL